MPHYNHTIIIGHATRDPELHTLQSGTSVCKFGIACNETFKKSDGSKGERVLFIDCEAWGKTGEVIAQHITKGDALLVDGSLQLDQWEGKDGEKRSKIKLRVNSTQFITVKKWNEQRAAPSPAQQPREALPTDSDGAGDNLPF